jgi:DNA invertase Pin-like site-specific DNA recombinase
MERVVQAVIYARFSPRRNSDQCESIEAQTTLCRKWCEEKRIPIRSEHSDAAVSGKAEYDRRPGLWDAIKALHPGDALVVYKLDRLARDVCLSFVVERDVKRRKAQIVSVSGEGTWGDDSDEQTLMRSMLQVFAEYERKVIAARTSAAMKQHQANGRRMSSKTPFGYRLDPNDASRIVVDEGEQACIKRIGELRTQGRSLRGIVELLTEEGWKPRGKRWARNFVWVLTKRFGFEKGPESPQEPA